MSKKNRKHSVSKPSSSRVDVVITTAGRWDFLRECLTALRAQTLPVNIILLDHASPIDERNQNLNLFEGVTTKRLEQNIGFPQSNNEASRMGRAPLILFLNDDCVLEPDAVEQMVATMDEQETIGICGAKLLFPPNSTSPIRPAGKVQHIGIGLTIKGDAIHPLLGWSPENPHTCHSRDVFAVTGACLMIRRSLFSRVNGFDLRYGIGTYEDVDLCLKVRQVGFRVFVNVNARGYHYAGATSEKKMMGFPQQMNASIFKTKWANTPLMFWDEWTWATYVDPNAN